MEFYLAIKTNELPIYATMWKYLKYTMLIKKKKKSDTKKTTYTMILFI